MTAELAVRDNGAIETVRQSSGLALSFAEMTMRVRQLDQFYSDVMQDGTDYGVIPGTGKPSLFQPGAQMLDQIFGLVPSFEVIPTSVIDWERPIPFFHYIVRCRLLSRQTGELVAEAIGSCNTHEDRYRWRKSRKTCPSCGSETIGRSRAEYGGGYFCNKKNGGCGSAFKGGTDEARELDQQPEGRTENEDTASLENTVLKMAQKRAHVAATLNATGASRIFTQDVEDLPQFQQATVIRSESRPVDDAGPTPATDEQRAKFEAVWKKGTKAAAECGVAIPDKPADTATNAELTTTLRELSEEVANRRKVNAEMLDKMAQVKAAGADIADVDPAQATTREVMEMIETLNEMLSAVPDAVDDTPF